MLLSALLQTALHWAAKHGDENIVKLIAGHYKDYIKSINETSVSRIENLFRRFRKFADDLPLRVPSKFEQRPRRFHRVVKAAKRQYLFF